MPTLPFKLNQNRRQHIPKQKHKITNSAAYDAALRQRGSLTAWFTDEAVAAWKVEPRSTLGGQPWYSPLARLGRRASSQSGVHRAAAFDGRAE